jgi:hypothetical protein
LISWAEQEEKIPDEQFAEIEEEIGVKLPKDYIHWVQQYASPEDGNTYLLVDGKHYHFDAFYPPDSIIEEFEALYFGEEEFKEFGLLVPFAFDGSLNHYCFYYRPGNLNPLILWKDKNDALEAIFDKNKLNNRVQIFGSSFTEFINALYHPAENIDSM